MSSEKTTSVTSPASIQAALVAMRSSAAAPAQPTTPRAPEQRATSDLHSHIYSHRTELESIDVRISSLDRSIELEQQKLRESKASLDESYQARRDLMHLRLAMVHFVQELESKQVGD